jgi:hypothetical protein
MFSTAESLDAALAVGWRSWRNPLVVALVIPVAGLALNVVLQIMLLRIAQGRGFMRTVAKGFFAGGVFTFAAYLSAGLAWCSPGNNAGVLPLLLEWLCVICPTYAGLGYGYANFANLGNTSIRIRLCEELRHYPEGRPVEDIRQQYSESSVLSLRLHRLSEGGDLVKAGDRWRVNRRRFVWIGGIIFSAKQAVLGRRSEFDSN